MWYFGSPLIVFGDDALEYLYTIQGKRALVVTDSTIVKLGFVDRVVKALSRAGIESRVFDEVEPDPSLQTIKKGATVAMDYKPDWLIGLGGGSSMDAAKGIWVLYSSPDVSPDSINPTAVLNLRDKAHLITIPTTAGTGAEVTWMIVVTDRENRRKIGVGSRETMPDVAILDTSLTMGLPPQITADTGMDALCHAIEGYTSLWRNDFSNAQALTAIKNIFTYLPRAYHNGADAEARVHLAYSATLAGLSFGNVMAGLAHSLGHALGGLFHIPHGRAVGLFLPYTMEYLLKDAEALFSDIGRFLEITGKKPEVAKALITRTRELLRAIGQPVSISQTGIDAKEFEGALPELLDRAANEATTITIARIPDEADLVKIFKYSYDGKHVDF
jgi:alcohol dehydrogenase class IV